MLSVMSSIHEISKAQIVSLSAVLFLLWLADTQHDDTQYNGSQYNDGQHHDTQHDNGGMGGGGTVGTGHGARCRR
jgi:hypothetical protein